MVAMVVAMVVAVVVAVVVELVEWSGNLILAVFVQVVLVNDAKLYNTSCYKCQTLTQV